MKTVSRTVPRRLSQKEHFFAVNKTQELLTNCPAEGWLIVLRGSVGVRATASSQFSPVRNILQPQPHSRIQFATSCSHSLTAAASSQHPAATVSQPHPVRNILQPVATVSQPQPVSNILQLQLAHLHTHRRHPQMR